MSCDMATPGSVWKRSLVAAFLVVIVSGCSGSTDTTPPSDPQTEPAPAPAAPGTLTYVLNSDV